MLIWRATLDGIVAGRIDLAFRRQRRPTVKAGGTLRTAVGVLAIDAVDAVSEDDITEEEATRAGFRSRAELLASLKPEGQLNRIALRYLGPDPRIELRSTNTLSAQEIQTIQRRLDRFDRASSHGPWTATTLRLIADNPGTRAPDLAAVVGRETQPFKTDVRKLKELGLTESLRIGYQLSPRGQAFLRRSRGPQGS
jgi:hypothetical protein